MSRRTRRNRDVNVTLFPFLAVLICTMGSLIVLLVVVVQQASQQTGFEQVAEAVTKQPSPVQLPKDTQRYEELTELKEDLTWQAEMLSESREQTKGRLQEQEQEISRAEDHARRLKGELDALFVESQRIEQITEQQLVSHEQAESRLSALAADIETTKLQLANHQDQSKSRQKRFALVPYEGQHGTRRRPIYIECLADNIVLQPEGVVLTADDFRYVGDGNVLITTIRAMREYYVNQGIVENSAEPYPLIVVRPGGASAFTACRSALSDWSDDFGYELLTDDIQLSFPPVDPSLQQLVERTVAETRWRLQQATQTRQSEYVLGVSSQRGGFVSQGGGPRPRGGGGVDQYGNLRGSEFPDRGASGAAPGGAGTQAGVDLALGYGAGQGTAASDGRSRPGQGGLGQGGLGQGAEHASPGPASGTAASSTGGVAAMNRSAPGGTSGSSSLVSGNGTLSEGTLEPSAPGQMNGTASGSNSGLTGSATNPAAFGQSSAPASAAANAPPNASPGSFSQTEDSGASVVSISVTQGANWALPGAANGAIAIQRPVSIAVRADEIVLLPESGTSQQQVALSLIESPAASVKNLVSALWNRVDDWGIAGTGSYWKPVLEAEVAPDANHRYDQIVRLLQDSGIALTRKQ